jgi:hypothetical protein
MLLVMALVSAILLMAVNSVNSQFPQQDQGYSPAYGGGYAVPGVPGVNLGPGTNTIALSASVSSQQGNQIFFQVNSFAIVDQQTNQATVYELNNAMPGIMDTSNNRVQIDIAKLQSSIQSTSTAAMDDLYSILRPSVNSLMVLAQISQQGQEGSRATFQVENLKVIMPDGQTNTFDLSQPMTIVVDATAMRVFAVGFEQMYTLVNTYIVNIQNNYYTEINYNIIAGPTIIVTPPILYPVLTPIIFPAAWPVFFPVPVPVPIPVITVTPHPPSITPTMKPTVSPTMKPTVSPTMKPTVSPTMKPTVSPKVSPTKKVTATPTVSPTMKPTVSPTKKATVSPKASLAIPTKIASPIATKGPITTFKPSLVPTKVVTPKPTKSPIATFKASPIAPITTKKPVSTQKPISTIKPIGPITTKKPAGGGAPIATYKAPIVTKPTKTPAGGGAPIATYKAPAGGKVPRATTRA